MENSFNLLIFCLVIYGVIEVDSAEPPIKFKPIPTCTITNEIYSIDMAAPTCEKSCSNKDIVCTNSILGWAGCKCKKDYIRNDKNECIPIAECKKPEVDKTCYAGEHYYEAGSNCKQCELTCRIRKKKCAKECLTGCYCKTGYLRNAANKCVDENSCEPAEAATLKGTLTHILELKKTVRLNGTFVMDLIPSNIVPPPK